MGDKNETGFGNGFSDEEKEDLDRMIGRFNKGRQTLVLESSDGKLERQMEVVMDRFAQLGEIVSKTNKRLDSFFEIVQLMHRKSEILNDRINTLVRALEKNSDTITE